MVQKEQKTSWQPILFPSLVPDLLVNNLLFTLK